MIATARTKVQPGCTIVREFAITVGLFTVPQPYDEAVAVGIASFLEGDDPPSDDTVLTRLDQTGVESWLAVRLLVFLPLAFGRRVLTGVNLSDEFFDGPALRPLAEEPVFRAAMARAERASRPEVERIGLRSSEVDAVNNALNRGSRLEDLTGSPVALADPLPPPGDGDGGVPSPRTAFVEFLRGHGYTVENLRVGDLEVDARVFAAPRTHPERVMVQVDFEARHPALATGRLLESFAGTGATWREAIVECIRKFERASLHPIIAALIDRTAGQDQVGWEPYAHPAGPFDLCLGAQITLYAPQGAPPAGPLLDRLLEALREVPLSRAVHSLRLFVYHRDGDLLTNEVLLDGDDWTAGQAVVAAAPAPTTTGVIGVRIFGLLVPAAPST